jgi:hypothetical protein
MNVEIFHYDVIFELFIRRRLQCEAQILQNKKRQNVRLVVYIMQIQIMRLVQTKLNDHYIFRAKNVFQIIDEYTFNDEHAHSNKFLLHFDRIWIKQKMIVFQKMMRDVCICVDSRLLNSDDVKFLNCWIT